MEPGDRNTRIAWRAGVRCYCAHLPTEHQRPRSACGVGDCECRWYRPDRGGMNDQAWSLL
jgi:hypothetical protein